MRREIAGWVDLEAPAEAEWEWLRTVRHVHPLHVEDCQHFSELPKIDVEREYLFLVLHVPAPEPPDPRGRLRLVELDLFLFEDGVVSVHMEQLPWLEQLRGRVEALAARSPQRPDRLFHALVDHAVDALIPSVQALLEQVDELGEEIWAGRGRRAIRPLRRLLRSAAQLRRSIEPEAVALTRLMHEESRLGEETRPYLKDVADHLDRLQRDLEFLQHNALALFESHLAIQSQQSNRVMQRLTVISAIFLPLSWIAGVYGMNFRHMPELAVPWAYPAVLGFMFALGLALFVYFRRAGWLD
ncbi:MAG: magnesium transporter CorA family protein [Bacillota bacterium]|nr:magnesium transporter CorA family protein [Bacillota bacterium]